MKIFNKIQFTLVALNYRIMMILLNPNLPQIVDYTISLPSFLRLS